MATQSQTQDHPILPHRHILDDRTRTFDKKPLNYLPVSESHAQNLWEYITFYSKL